MPLPLLPETLRVPLFPLPGVVLFPGTILPLRVFEPRYRQLLSDAMAGQKLIGMPQLMPATFLPETPGGDSLEGTSPVFDVLGVGRVVAHQTLPDGTSHIALLGQARFRILEEIPHSPYRIAIVRQLKEQHPTDAVSGERLRQLVYDLKQLARRVAAAQMDPEALERLNTILHEQLEPGPAADLLASVFVHDSNARQNLLECASVAERVARVNLILGRLAEKNAARAPLVKHEKDQICLN